MKRYVVTGAASGFGYEITRRLLATGAQVVATDATLEGLHRAFPIATDGLTVVSFDMGDPPGIDRALGAVVAAGPIDGVVHNAGYALFNALEDAVLSDVERLWRCNVLGTVCVMRALLGSVRERSGSIVVISSVAGRMAFPESGFYAAAKHALEALAEAWYLENASAGVRVNLVQPGAFNTGFARRAAKESAPRSDDLGRQRDYAIWDARKREVLAEPQDPQVVAEVVVEALSSPVPFQRLPVGRDGEAIVALRDALGSEAFVRLMGERVGGPLMTGGAFDRRHPAWETAVEAGFLTYREDVPDDAVPPDGRP